MIKEVSSTTISAFGHQTLGEEPRNSSIPPRVAHFHKLHVLPIGLLRDNIDSKKVMRALAFMFMVKAMFKSGAVHHATYQRLSDLTGVGRAKAKIHVTVLKEMGLVRWQGDTLIFGSFDPEGKYKKFEIQDYSHIDITNLKEVEKFIRLQAVRIKQSQIDHAVSKLKARRDPQTLREFKGAMRGVDDWNGRPDQGQSIYTVQEVSGLGVNSAVDLLKWGEIHGLLKKEKRIERVPYYPSRVEELAESHTHCKEFYYGGRRYLVRPSILLFN